MTGTNPSYTATYDDIPIARDVKPIAPPFKAKSTTNIDTDLIDNLTIPKRPKWPNEDQLSHLKRAGFTEGLARAMYENCEALPIRFWVVDNSGSMNRPDGHRIVSSGGGGAVRVADCTRWEEIRECVFYHADDAAILEVPTIFRLLNDPGARAGPQEFSVSTTTATTSSPPTFNPTRTSDQQIYQTRKTMNATQPSGFTPLRNHILEIHRQILPLVPSLHSSGRRAVIVLATDGTPTDEMGYSSERALQDFVTSIRLLEGLPVWIVIRLCTDDEEVVSFYNDLDENLELNLEVLDDWEGEAKEVGDFNPWLNYGLALHRAREGGFHDRVLDLVDERALTKDELRRFLVLLLGEAAFDGVPDPCVDWAGFRDEVGRLIRAEGLTWDPVKKRLLPWVDVRVMNRMYGNGAGGGGCGCIMM